MSRSTNRKPLITLVNPKSPISEAYRNLRTNIEFSAIDESVQVVMVTSAGPSEGKSTTAANLAVTYAQNDKKTLIIDADLRKPTLHRVFTMSNRWGLTNLLSGQIVQTGEAIQETSVDNLYLLPSGPIPPNPSEILASRRMSQLLEDLRQKYDKIIIDTPPALAVTDAQIVATKSDGTMIVISSGEVKRDAALKTKAKLEHVKARILGVVLNNVDRKLGEAYYYYYYGSKESH